jgi:hypothetical protein
MVNMFSQPVLMDRGLEPKETQRVILRSRRPLSESVPPVTGREPKSVVRCFSELIGRRTVARLEVWTRRKAFLEGCRIVVLGFLVVGSLLGPVSYLERYAREGESPVLDWRKACVWVSTSLVV